MFRIIALTAVLFLLLSIVPASGPVTIQNDILTILPEDCEILVGEELLLKLSGPLPSNAVVTWDVDYGAVASILPGTNAVLIAPALPSTITIYATISDTKPGRWIYVTRQCIVSLPNEFDG
jgi:hypothetical protein